MSNVCTTPEHGWGSRSREMDTGDTPVHPSSRLADQRHNGTISYTSGLCEVYPLMISLLPSPSNSLSQILLNDLLPAGKVTRSDLRVDLDARVGWDQVIGNVVSLVDGDARFNDCVVFPERSVRATIIMR